jgi:hypothetical protein
MVDVSVCLALDVGLSGAGVVVTSGNRFTQIISSAQSTVEE